MPGCVFQVFGRCQCAHHTTGDHCEKCAPLYNDRPWRPANSSSGEPNPCRSKCDQQRCEAFLDAFQTDKRIKQSDSCPSWPLWLQGASATGTPTAVTSPSERGSPQAAPAEGFATGANTTRWAADASAVATVTTATPLCPSAPPTRANVRSGEQQGAVRGVFNRNV